MKSLEGFREYLLDNGQSLPTVYTNLKLIKRALRECHPISKESFKTYITSYIRLGRKRSYIKQIIIVVKFWAEYQDFDDLKDYPFPPKKFQAKFKRAKFADVEIDAFLNLKNPYKKNTFNWKRFEMWTTFWSICAYEGNRPGEAIKLRKYPTKEEPSTIDFGRNVIIFSGKNRTREVPISFVIREQLIKFVAELEGEYFFPPLRKTSRKYMTCQAWEHDFDTRLERLEEIYPGISTRLNLDPYSLRKSAATRWNRDNWAFTKIQEALGHSQVNTTMKYIDTDTEEVEEMINNDRLVLKFKKGIDLLHHCVDFLRGIEGKSVGKLLISSFKVSRDGRRYSIVLEAID